jgi:TrfB plasmid transcriptional repressor
MATTGQRMTAEQFEALRPRLGRLALDSVEIARAVLVDGLKPTEVAATHKMTRQRVHGIVSRFRAAANQVPTGWKRVEVWLPPELAAEVEAMAEKARADYARTSNPGN